jgi:hypothetical protein
LSCDGTRKKERRKGLIKSILKWAGIAAVSVAAVSGIFGCSKTDVREEVVATVDGEVVKIRELREFLGFRGGRVPAVGIPVEKKKEALDRLIAGRLLAAEARRRGLDNTQEFREVSKRGERAALITAFLRKEMDARDDASGGEVKDEAKRLRAADGKLSEDEAKARAMQAATDRKIRRLEDETVASARKDLPFSIDNGVIGRIGAGEKVDEGAVLATAGGEKISYGQVRKLVAVSAVGPHGGEDFSRNPIALMKVVEREATGRALEAYARKKGIEGTAYLKETRQEIERAILIDLLVEKALAKEVSVSEKEIEAAYNEHSQMFIKDGKKIPLSAVKGQIRNFLEGGKKRKAVEDAIGGLRKKAKVTINESLLPKA